MPGQRTVDEIGCASCSLLVAPLLVTEGWSLETYHRISISTFETESVRTGPGVWWMNWMKDVDCLAFVLWTRWRSKRSCQSVKWPDQKKEIWTYFELDVSSLVSEDKRVWRRRRVLLWQIKGEEFFLLCWWEKQKWKRSDRTKSSPPIVLRQLTEVGAGAAATNKLEAKAREMAILACMFLKFGGLRNYLKKGGKVVEMQEVDRKM